jgi:hypothetical protein
MTLERICPCLTWNGDVPPRQQLTKPWLPLWFLFGRFDFADERCERPRTIGIRYRTFRR